MTEQRPDIALETLNPVRVHAELEASGLMKRPSYLNIACVSAEDSTAVWQSADAYKAAYLHTSWRLGNTPLGITHAAQELGTQDGTAFRMVAMGTKPAELLARTFLRAEARPDGALPHMSFVALLDETKYPEPETLGYFYNTRAVHKVAEQYRDVFDRMGYTTADPHELATAVITDRSFIGRQLLLGHSLEHALFGNLVDLYYDVAMIPEHAQRIIYESEVTKIFGEHSPQEMILRKLANSPASVRELHLLEHATGPANYLPEHPRTMVPRLRHVHAIWATTGMEDFIHRQRLLAFGSEKAPWFKAL
ncbi:MAG TPA: hypothetical protein VLE73_05560 [Candidatus Saccharimonadales bacterium]|nr:hypothetical protein [Candidatus Saccharimonadales bacterium]